jgi:hypothetical protein
MGLERHTDHDGTPRLVRFVTFRHRGLALSRCPFSCLRMPPAGSAGAVAEKKLFILQPTDPARKRGSVRSEWYDRWEIESAEDKWENVYEREQAR